MCTDVIDGICEVYDDLRVVIQVYSSVERHLVPEKQFSRELDLKHGLNIGVFTRLFTHFCRVS